jgi:hypothetical protein
MPNKVKTNLAGTTIETFIMKTETYLKSLQKPMFGNIYPAVADVMIKVSQLKTLQDQVIEGSHKAVVLRNALRKEVNADMSRMCEWVNIYAHGDSTILNECSFEVCKPRTAAPIPGGIKKLIVYKASESGKAQIAWKGNGSKFYRTQMTVDPTSNESWKDVATVTSNRCELAGLPVGRFCYFRVQGVNASGAGEFSDVYVYMAC